MNVKLAVPVEGENVYRHFGKATRFALYTIAQDKVVEKTEEETGGLGHADLALWLVMRNVEVVLCGTIGPGALGALTAAGIQSFAGLEGSVETAVSQFIRGELEVASAPTCPGHGGGCGGGCHGGNCHSGCHGCH